MAWFSPFQENRQTDQIAVNHYQRSAARRRGILCGFGLALAAGAVAAQVITVDTRTGTVTNGSTSSNAQVDRRYQQITPTKVTLSNSELDAKTRLELIRALQAEQGFAMRPFPRGHRGLTLAANGKLNPAGESYLNMVISEGLCAKPGDRVVLTDIKFDHAKMVFDLDGGPDPRHRFLRHVQVGAGPVTNPVIQGDDKEPVGARITLEFKGHVPELTGAQVKALLAPLISFDVKTPIEAFTDTLPKKLKDAILNHQVLVGMSTDMVLFAKGAPEHKTRETDGQTPFEEWIYGQPPAEVDFVRINGNSVIRLEVAKVGETPVIFTRNEVEGLMRTDGTPLEAKETHKIEMGDAERDPNRQAPTAPPTLRNPGEKLPSDDDNTRVMKPVQFPTQKPAAQPGTNPDGEPDAQPTGQTQPASPDGSAPASAKPQPAPASPGQTP